jgi:hypothetical protein
LSVKDNTSQFKLNQTKCASSLNKRSVNKQEAEVDLLSMNLGDMFGSGFTSVELMS